jgi:hypothetical protein
MLFDLEDSLEVSLKKAIKLNLIIYAENVEDFLLEKF